MATTKTFVRKHGLMCCKYVPIQYSFRARNEISILKKLERLPRVAQYVDHAESDTDIVIVTQLCCGGGIDKRSTKTEHDTRSIIKNALLALEVCHSNNIIHGDIKPDKFVYASSQRTPESLVLVDFDMSVDTTRVVRNEKRMTPLYASPERLLSQVDSKGDIWSIGVMGFHLLTGRYPFTDWSNPDNPSVEKIYHSILFDNVNRCVFPYISDQCKDFLQQTLIKNPSDRPSVEQCLRHKWFS